MAEIQVNKIDISGDDRARLVSLITRYLPSVKVWAFGSRINGKARTSSDIDLAAFTGPEHRLQLSLLREALEESRLSFRVDLWEWDKLPASFKNNILAAHITLI
jgi:predicted nucleotidyltransferase